MGYTTDFDGQFGVSPCLSGERIKTLEDFAAEDHRDEAGVPGYYCQWVPADDGNVIQWDGGEKFYDYVAWLEYLIGRFLKPWGCRLDGEVTWAGEDPDDRGKIVVADNVVTVKPGRVVYD